MKIAIASSDGRKVDLHFGKANSIYIYDFDGENAKCVEHRIVNIVTNEQHQWRKVLDIILDCDVVISVQSGFKSRFGIEKAGLKNIEDEGLIEDVLKKYIDHYKFMNN
ncbi:MAG: FeMo cofactor biosynthesis protein [Methanobrevibacter sp.]|jgi:predicted Fe-Mo cluster-binding NifX family protein|nr:FeMo cofactor biosynthesis protein [Candidatus Methanovirga basalitermitum]